MHVETIKTTTDTQGGHEQPTEIRVTDAFGNVLIISIRNDTDRNFDYEAYLEVEPE